MIYVSIISIVLWPLFANFISNLINVKNKILTSFLFIPLLLQVIWFFIMLNPGAAEIYNMTKNLFVATILLYFISIIFFSVWQYKKNQIVIDLAKIKYSWIVSVKEYVPYAIAFGIALIFTIFTWAFEHDTWYYIKISNNFKQSLFTADGISTLQTNIYRFPAMYYAISVFFPENIQMGFYLLMPLINVFIGVATVNLCMTKFKIANPNLKMIIASLLSIAIMFIILSTASYSTSGNRVVQGLLFAAVISNIFTSKDFKIENNCIVICLSMLYFSSTGLMLCLPLVATVFIIRAFRIGINRTLELLPLILILIIASFITFIPSSDTSDIFVADKLMSTIYYITFAVSVVAIIVLLIFKQKIQMKTLSIEHHINTNKIWKIAFASFFVLVIIGSIVMWGFGYSKNVEHYVRSMWIFYMFIYLALGSLFLFQFSKDSKINYMILFLFLLNSIALIEAVICDVAKIADITASLWRLNFLLIGFGNVPDICINFTMILIILLSPFYYHWKNLRFKNPYKISIHSRKISIISSSFLVLVSIFACLGSYLKLFPDTFLFKFNSDVAVNTQGVTNHDKNIIKSLKFINFSDGYLTDMQISHMIDNGVDLTYRLGTKGDVDNLSYISESYIWNFYDFTHAIDKWNKADDVNKITNTPSGISDHLKITINNLLNNPAKSISGRNIDTISYLIFNKNTTYFSAIDGFLRNSSYNSIDGDNMKVFYLKSITIL